MARGGLTDDERSWIAGDPTIRNVKVVLASEDTFLGESSKGFVGIWLRGSRSPLYRYPATPDGWEEARASFNELAPDSVDLREVDEALVSQLRKDWEHPPPPTGPVVYVCPRCRVANRIPAQATAYQCVNCGRLVPLSLSNKLSSAGGSMSRVGREMTNFVFLLLILLVLLAILGVLASR